MNALKLIHDAFMDDIQLTHNEASIIATDYILKTSLQHHGIEGQKWGVRHGPPYPLSRNTKNTGLKEDMQKKR